MDLYSVERNEKGNLRGDADGLVITPNSMAKFETETPFIITYTSGGEYSAQYHTSCSSDIVGIPEIECPELIVSGWRDNDGYANGDDCDDGFEPCECSPTTTTTIYWYYYWRCLLLVVKCCIL